MTSQSNLPADDTYTTPSVSVIVTNYNYGHYIEACLNSLRMQTSPPDEIIVVNDGSTDGSADILSLISDDVVIDQPNGGQAAAFNTGFAASTGEIVIFVDADDKLHPQALEVIRRLWADDISILSYGLSMIDGQGKGIGRYKMDVPDVDLLGQLLNRLEIPFMPTSGNAFRRTAIEWAFPLPTERWRISADALLIRAAVLAAPIRQIRQVLGAYRVHGQNNFFRSGATGPWKVNRGVRDVAQAGLDLIALADRGGRDLPRADRIKLLIAAVRCQLKAESLKFDPKALAAFQRQVMRLSRSRRLTFSLGLSLYAARFSTQALSWANDPRSCPRVLIAISRMIRGRSVTEALAERIPQRAPFDVRLSPVSAGSKDPMEWPTGPEWVYDHHSGRTFLCAPSGRLELGRMGPGLANLSVDLKPSAGNPVSVTVYHNGLLLGSHDLSAREVLKFTLPQSSSAHSTPDLIEFQTRDLVAGRFGPLSRMWRKSNRLQINKIRFEPLPAEPNAGVLLIASPVLMSHLGDVVQKSNGRVLKGEQLIGSGETLSLALPALKAPYCLSIRLSADQVVGHLNVTMNGEVICSADLVPGGYCLIEMPGNLTVFSSPALLQFGFQPEEFLDDPVVAIHDLCWLPHRVEGRYGLQVLVPGMWVGPCTGRSLYSFLDESWQRLPDGTAAMLGSSAGVSLSKAGITSQSVLRLDLEPMDVLASQERLVLVVSVDGEERTAVQLAGPARIEVVLGANLSDDLHMVQVEFYAATRPEDRAEAGDHRGIKLSALGLSPQAEDAVVSYQPPGGPVADIHVGRLLADLRCDLRMGADGAKLEALRDALGAAVSALSPSAAQGALAAGDLGQMAALSAKLQMQGPCDVLPVPQDDWVRDLTLRILHGPAFATLRGVDLHEFPDLTPDFAEVLGAYLVADPAFGAERSELQAYQEHLVEMMVQARAILACAPEKSPLAKLADAMVRSFRARKLLFSDLPLRPHVAAFGRALEAKLLREGHDLFAPQIRSVGAHGNKQRIGVILQNTKPSPETWIWRALLRDLPKREVEITLFLIEQKAAPITGFEGCAAVSLADQPLAVSVAAIRGAQIDVMLMGAHFYGYGFIAQICAHRLAPRQIALSGVTPSTTGLSSVDTFVMGTSVAPKRVVSDYCEEVIWAPGAGQAFDIPQAQDEGADMRRMTRRRLGVGEDDVILVSGAMHDKIGPDVLGVWTQALAAAPSAVLVLYPFAANWQQNYDAPAFNARVAAACDAQGIDPSRVRILPPIPNWEVKQVLAAADLYLDSFPYSGATTTVEALQCALPVVALQGQSQRGHQAAGWLIEFGLRDLVAKSQRGYVKIVADLAGDGERRAQVKARIAETREKAMGQHGFAKWFEAFLLPQTDQPKGQFAPPRYLFNHIPKTGGTSLKKVFANWFDVVDDYREPWAHFMPPKQDLDSLGPEHLLCGHFAIDPEPLKSRYPETADPQRWRKITFLRDPLERAISMHAYEKKFRQEYDQTYELLSLGEYLTTSYGQSLKHFECDESNWRAALDAYWFIGTLERLPECLDYLAAKLGKPAPGILPHENSTARDEDFTPEDVAIFRAHNAFEFEIYDAVCARLDTLLSQHSRD